MCDDAKVVVTDVNTGRPIFDGEEYLYDDARREPWTLGSLLCFTTRLIP
jgi:hypothetical protein